MKKTMLKALCLITAALMLTAVIPFTAFAKTAPATRDIWDGSVAGSFAGGSGTAEDPYLISNGAELAYLSEQVDAGETYEDCFIELTNDICLNDTDDWQNWSAENPPANSWKPIGGRAWQEGYFYHYTEFMGRFHGNGYTVSGVYFHNDGGSTSNSSAGLFGRISDGEVLCVNVRESKFIVEDAYMPLGTIVGCSMFGTVQSCISDSIVIGTDTVGGIVGANAGGALVDNCRNLGVVKGWLHVGGIFGMGSGWAENCINQGSVWQTEQQDGVSWGFGGIVGASESGWIRYCMNTGSVNGGTAVGVGGIVGVSDMGAEEIFLSVEYCSNSGHVLGNGNVGGIIGWDGDTPVYISNCYNRASIFAENAAGGIVGYMYANGGGSLETCYNASSVYGGTAHSLIGMYSEYAEPQVDYCYYLIDICEGNDEFGTALTDQQLRSPINYVGFDFEGVWTMEGDPDYPYAELTGQAPAQLLPGDVDGDGEVTVADALLALRASMGLVELNDEQQAAANVDGDEEITVADALMILRASMGLLEL